MLGYGRHQHSGHLTSGPLMYIRKTATLWLVSLTLILLAISSTCLGLSTFTAKLVESKIAISNPPLLLAASNSLPYTGFTPLG